MSWLESAIGWLSPKLALRRARARIALEQLRSYEASARTDRTSNWRPRRTSPLEDTRELDTLVARSRDAIRNNPWVRSGGRTIRGNVVGTGIVPVFQAENDGQEAEIAAAWKAWAERPVDVAGRLTFAKAASLVMNSVISGGEALVKRVFLPGAIGPEALRLQVLEGDLIDSAKNEPAPEGGGNTIIQGVQFDALGRITGLWLLDQHPSGMVSLVPSANVSRLVPIDQLLHVFDDERPGQVRGVPWPASVLVRARDADETEDAALLRAKVSACFAAAITDANAENPTISAGTKREQGTRLEHLEPAQVSYLEAGQSIDFSDPPDIGPVGDQLKHYLRGIAKGLGTTYESLTGDLAGVNFSSGRMGWIDSAIACREWQLLMMVPLFCDPVLRWFLAAYAAAGGNIEGVTWAWRPPQRLMLDPVKETEALLAQVGGGIKSLEDAILQVGGSSSEETLARLAKDMNLAKSLGLTLSVMNAEATAAGEGETGDDGNGTRDDAAASPRAPGGARRVVPARNGKAQGRLVHGG